MFKISRIFCAVLIAGLILSAAQAEERSERKYRLPHHGFLELSLPHSWTDEVRRRPFDYPPTIVLRAGDGDEFRLMITPLWSRSGENEIISDEKVRQMMEQETQAMKANAVEEQLVLHPIKGTETYGYYYMATDKAPKPGEWKYVLRAGVACGELVISGTLFTHHKESPARGATLELLRTAKQISEATARSMGIIDDRYPPKIPRNEEYHPPTPEQKMWALATYALITEHNRAQHDLLGGYERTPERITKERVKLAEWWGVQNREDLIDTLKWIETGGHRKDFDLMQEYIKVLPPDEKAAFLEYIGADAEMHNKLDVITSYRLIYGDSSIAGWDYARYTALCGWGYVAGYFDEDEAWRKMMPAARLLQQTFKSWEDLGRNYLIGREYWSLEQTRKAGQSMGKSFEKLCTDPDSPWKTIPWDIDLTPGKSTKPE